MDENFPVQNNKKDERKNVGESIGFKSGEKQIPRIS